MKYGLYKPVIVVSLLFALSGLSCETYKLDRLSDLIIENVEIVPSQVTAGNSVTVSCQVKNRGDGLADFPILQFEGLYFFFSSDPVFQRGDDMLDTENIDDLEVGQSQAVDGISLTIPGGISPGTYYIIFYIDYLNDIEELNEDNNTGYIGIEIVP